MLLTDCVCWSRTRVGGQGPELVGKHMWISLNPRPNLNGGTSYTCNVHVFLRIRVPNAHLGPSNDETPLLTLNPPSYTRGIPFRNPPSKHFSARGMPETTWPKFQVWLKKFALSIPKRVSVLRKSPIRCILPSIAYKGLMCMHTPYKNGVQSKAIVQQWA